MYLMKRLFMLFLVAVLVLPGVLFPLHVQAQVRSAVDTPLLGSGSSDDVNIIKIMDMALNKAGLSMSPAKIPQFVEYWWSCVKSDLQILINDADRTITTVSDFVDYVASAAADPSKHDGLKMMQVTLKFARFCATQEIKTLDDYKNLLVKDNIFRMFLMSFLVDQETSLVPGNGINKGGRYKLASDFVKMVRQAVDAYIEEYEGYYLFSTSTYKDIPVSLFSSKSIYDDVILTLRSIPDHGVFAFTNNYAVAYRNYFYDCGNINLVGKLRDDKSSFFISGTYSDDWVSCAPYCMALVSGGIDLSNFDSTNVRSFGYLYVNPVDAYGGGTLLLSSDVMTVKIWKSLDGLKNYSVGKSDIYYANTYSSFDNSVDNSIEFTGAYYSSTNTSYSHQNIQNTIDNSQETINESTVNNIVNNYITNVTNNYNSSGSGSGEGSGGDWNLGEGIEAFVKGVAELLDFVLKLLGELIGLLATFATSVLDVLKGLAVVGTSFGDFLKAVFGFLPDECISLIMSSIGVMCLVGVIKVFKK